MFRSKKHNVKNVGSRQILARKIGITESYFADESDESDEESDEEAL